MGNRATASLLTAPRASRATPDIPLSKGTALLSKGTALLSKGTACLSKGTAPRPRPALLEKDWAELPIKRSAVGWLVPRWGVPSTPLPAAVRPRHLPVHPPSRVTAATSNPAPVRCRRQVMVLPRRDRLRTRRPQL